MAGLSSLLWGDDASDEPSYRQATAEADRVAGVCHLLGDPGNDRLIEFTLFAAERGIDVSRMWLGVRNETLLAAALPVFGAGRAALLMLPDATRPAQEKALAEVIRRATDDALHTSRLCQVLLDPANRYGLRACFAAGYETLATLVYLQRQPGRPPAPPLAPGVSLLNYNARTHPRFAAAIAATYAQSLDCPALAGRRNIEDVIDSHKSAGTFDPALWFLLTRGNENLGVLLMSTHSGSGIELVYLGLTPPARGHKFGDWLMQLAVSVPATRDMDRITLAVDSDNLPALRLYFRHGFGETYRRVALMRFAV